MSRLLYVILVGLSSGSSALYFAADRNFLGGLYLVSALLWAVLVMIND